MSLGYSKTTLALLFSAVVLLAGCATPVANYQPVTIDVSEPPLNSMTVKQVGDEMVRQGKYREHDALHVQAPPYTVHAGYFLKMGEDQGGEFYRIGGAGEESGFVEKSPILKKD
jgi:hypothetical protein